MTELIAQTRGAIAIPEHARATGRRVKPILRLGMGVKVEGQRRDGSKYTRPDKTDYLTVRGDDRAVAAFKNVYGDKPKAVKILVPSALELALDISYRAFIGGGDDNDGRPLALGMTNFAPLGYAGGPDVLRVWLRDGSYAEVETQGLDELGKPLDEPARELGIELHSTLTFTIPDVLGWGSFAQITSKGRQTCDNLTFKLGEIYGAFGSKAPWAFDPENPPLLVIKPSTALTRFEKDGEAKWGKTKIFVLDIVIPEPFYEMTRRLADWQQTLAPNGAAAAIYGPGSRAQLGPGTPAAAGAPSSEPQPDGQTAGSEDGPKDGPPPVGPSSTAADEPALDDDEPALEGEIVGGDLEVVSAFVVPDGFAASGKSLGEVAEDVAGVVWLEWAFENRGRFPDEFAEALGTFVELALPDVHAKVTGEA